MLRTVKAHYTNGRIELLEPISLEEGTELEVTISLPRAPQWTEDATLSTAGAWSALLDCEEFEEEVYEQRLLNTRPDVSL